MAGLLGAYEDSDEDDDAPSILVQNAQQAAAAAAGEAGSGGATAPPAGDIAVSSTIESAPGKPETVASGSPPAKGVPVVANGKAAPSGIVLAASPSADDSSSGAPSPDCERDEDEVSLIPPSPPGEPDPELVERVRSLHDLRRRGKNVRDHIQGSRDWSNPYILERVIKVFELNEYGSNYPKEIFDPAKIAEHPSDYYDAPECERPPLPKRARKQQQLNRNDSTSNRPSNLEQSDQPP